MCTCSFLVLFASPADHADFRFFAFFVALGLVNTFTGIHWVRFHLVVTFANRSPEVHYCIIIIMTIIMRPGTGTRLGGLTGAGVTGEGVTRIAPVPQGSGKLRRYCLMIRYLGWHNSTELHQNSDVPHMRF
jgi:hypothetical protein